MNETNRPAASLRVAIAGAGPAGFYAADFLLKAGASVDMFERLPAPFGLVRYGVAPDHQKIKRVSAAFERTASLPGFGYYGNVEVGRDVSVEELLSDYDQLLLAIGSAGDRQLGIEGEDLAGSVAATSFVGWYNGHPDFVDQSFELGGERAVIVGMGNVALDVARILVRDPAELAPTDIADHALSALQKSSVREVVLVGRRGPAQAAFDQGELEDIADLAGVEVLVEKGMSFEEPAELSPAARRNLEYLRALPTEPGKKSRALLRLRFLAAPHRIVGEGGRVTGLEWEKTELVQRPDGSVGASGTGVFAVEPGGLVVRSIGYRGRPMPGLPFDRGRSVVPNQGGRVSESERPFPSCYVVGWIKRGPVGLLGTNKQDARETVDAMLADWKAAGRGSREPGRVLGLLNERKLRIVRYPDWQRIDQAERDAGAQAGKVRQKLYSVKDMLALLDPS